MRENLRKAFAGPVAETAVGKIQGAEKAWERFPEGSTRLLIWKGHGSPGFVQSGKGYDLDNYLCIQNLPKLRSFFNRLYTQVHSKFGR